MTSWGGGAGEGNHWAGRSSGDRVWLNLGREGLTGAGLSSNFFGSGGGLESRSLLISFLQSELTQVKLYQQSLALQSSPLLSKMRLTETLLLSLGSSVLIGESKKATKMETF